MEAENDPEMAVGANAGAGAGMAAGGRGGDDRFPNFDRDDDESDDEGDEDAFYEVLNVHRWAQIRDNDPEMTSIEFSWEEEATFGPGLDWAVEGRHLAANTHLKEVTLTGLEDNDGPVRSENMHEFLKGLAGNRTIESLRFVYCALTDGAVLDQLWSFFENNGALRGLELYFTTLRCDGDHNSLITRKISGITNLERIKLWSTYMSEETKGAIIGGLSACNRLESVSLGAPGIRDGTVSALVKLLRRPRCKIRDISLSHSGMTNEGLATIAAAMTQKSTVKKLDLSCTTFAVTSNGWRTFFAHVPNLPLALTELNLSGNVIDDRAIAGLGYALTNKNSLRVLDLSGNRFVTGSGWNYFSTHLQNPNCALKTLSLASNRIDDEQMLSLRNICDGMTCLDLTNIGISNKGVAALASSLRNNTTLETLRLSENTNGRPPLHNGWALSLASPSGVSPSGWEAFFKRLRHSSLALERLDLDDNSFDNRTIAALVKTFGSFRMLKILNLTNTRVTGKGLISLANLLRSSRCNLTELYLSRNVMSDQVLIAFADAMGSNASLRILQLAGNHLAEGSTVTARSWDAFADALGGRSSIDETYSANHTLHQLCVRADEFSLLPSDLVHLLHLNQSNIKANVARHKILRFHFSGGDDSDCICADCCRPSNANALFAMEFNILPHAIAWAGKDELGFPVLYHLFRNMPDRLLFEFNAKGNCTGLKRKRAAE